MLKSLVSLKKPRQPIKSILKPTATSVLAKAKKHTKNMDFKQLVLEMKKYKETRIYHEYFKGGTCLGYNGEQNKLIKLTNTIIKDNFELFRDTVVPYFIGNEILEKITFRETEKYNKLKVLDPKYKHKSDKRLSQIMAFTYWGEGGVYNTSKALAIKYLCK